MCQNQSKVNLSKQQTKIIHQASQSFLYHEGQPWVKKGDVNFDIGMGAYHGAQACEIVGLYMLNLLKDLPNFETILYRDDGLGVTPSTPRLQEKLRQNIIKKFAEQDLKITITINQKRVDFLDITMDSTNPTENLVISPSTSQQKATTHQMLSKIYPWE